MNTINYMNMKYNIGGIVTCAYIRTSLLISSSQHLGLGTQMLLFSFQISQFIHKKCVSITPENRNLHRQKSTMSYGCTNIEINKLNSTHLSDVKIKGCISECLSYRFNDLTKRNDYCGWKIKRKRIDFEQSIGQRGQCIMINRCNHSCSIMHIGGLIGNKVASKMDLLINTIGDLRPPSSEKI